MMVVRFSTNPIVRPDMDGRMGDNVNGPSLFAHRAGSRARSGATTCTSGTTTGRYSRLAYADDLAGPWRSHLPGSLALTDSLFHGHIASPDVHVDDERRAGSGEGALDQYQVQPAVELPPVTIVEWQRPPRIPQTRKWVADCIEWSQKSLCLPRPI